MKKIKSAFTLSLATGLAASSHAAISVDGERDASYGPPRAVQLAPTGFGDNSDPDILTANGSELNAVHAVIREEQLHLFFAGNLETNFNKLDVFIDSELGGQNVLQDDNPDVDLDGLNAMAGLKFAGDFEANYYFTIGGGDQGGGAGNEFFIGFAKLSVGLPGYGEGTGPVTGFPHTFTIPASQSGVASDQDILIGLDNSNTAGVTTTSVTGAAEVATGIEIAIPLTLLGGGGPSVPVKICAFINNSNHTFVSNQILVSAPADTANLGDSSEVDLSLLATGPSVGVPWQVANTNPDGEGSLPQAVTRAPSGSTVVFDPALGGETITLGGSEMFLDKELTISGFDLRPGITLDANQESRIFYVRPVGSLTLRGLTLTGGNGSGPVANNFGGAILNEGILNVQNCLLTGNEAQLDGGAISGSATISNSTFVDNAARNGAAVVMSSGTLQHCTITGNRVTLIDGQSRGAVFGFEANVTLANCVIAENEQFDVVSFGTDNPGVVRFEGQNIAPAITDSGTQGSLAGLTPLTSSPALMLLGNYGGPTLSRPPFPWSPAVDSGIVVWSPLPDDQRGAPRSGATLDLGAVEYQPAVVNTAMDQNDLPEGPELSLREALARPFVSSITFDPAVFDGESSDTIVLTNGQLVVEQSIGMHGDTVGGVTVDADGASTDHRVLHVSDSVVAAELWEMHLTGGTTPPNPELNGEFGGGILNEGRLILNSCSIYGNTTGTGATGAPGGGIYNSGDLTVRGGSIRDNTTGSGNNGASGPGGDGGGIFNAGFLEISGNTIIQSNATGTGSPRGNGGGIANIGELVVTQATLSGNQGGRGGGIWNDLSGSMSVEQSTIHSNSCNFAGGGIRNGADSDATIVACTLTNNTAGFDAGALYAGGTVEVVSSTIVGNRAGRDGGGVFVATSFSVRDSIVADNEALRHGPDLNHPFGPGPVALGVNLVSDLTDSSLTAGPSILVGDPLLAPLGDYGGPTPTMPLLPGSPAFDAGGATSSVATDQRGFSRVVNGALDIGATELQGALDLNFFWPTDWDGDGVEYGVEFTLGTDPLVSDRGNPRNPLAIGGDFPGIQFGLNRDFIQYLDVTITRSYDLQGPWTPIGTFDQAGNFLPLILFIGYVPFTEIEGVSRIQEQQPEGDRAFYRIETTPHP